MGIRKRDKIPIPTFNSQREFLECQSSDDEDALADQRKRRIKMPNGTVLCVAERKVPRYVNMEAEDIRASFASSLGVS